MGDYSASAMGAIVSVIGVVLASMKTILTNYFQNGNAKLHPLDLLFKMRYNLVR